MSLFLLEKECLLTGLLSYVQAPVLIKYPASLSLTAYSYCFATVFMVLTGGVTTNGVHEWALTTTEIIAILYAVSMFIFPWAYIT